MLLRKVQEIRCDALLGNSVALLLASGVMAGTGFLFWLLAARLFPASDVGLAGTLVALMNLIATLSLLGLDVALVRFLPSEKEPRRTVGTGLTVVVLGAVATASIAMLLVPTFAPPLSFIRASWLTTGAFIVFTAIAALNLLLEAVFLSRGKAEYTLLINAVHTTLRILLIALCVRFGAVGIFFAFALTLTIALIINLVVLARVLDLRPALALRASVLKRAWRYSANNYTAGLFNLLPGSLLPLIVAQRLGLEAAGFFSIAMMIGYLLYAIPWSAARSLFADSARDKTLLTLNTRRAIRMIAILLLPSILVLFFAGHYLLAIFGATYAAGSSGLLRMLALAAIPISIFSIFETRIRILHASSWLILTNALYAVTVFSLALLLSPMGLTGIGLAWFTGHCVAALSSAVIVRRITH